MIDPTLHYCTCGQTFKPRQYHKLLMLLQGEYSWRCPHCQTMMTFKLIHHVVKIETKPNKELNQLWEKC